jgi:hypothetical protein
MNRYLSLLAALSFAGCAGFGSQGSAVPTQIAPANSRVNPATNCPKLSGGTGLLSDGDFSQATQPSSYMGFNKGQSFAPSWRRVTKGAIKLVSSTYWNVNGLCSIDLDGGTAGTITHNGVTTTVNSKYTVTFYLSGNGDGGPAIKTLKLSAASVSKTFTWDTSNGNDPRHGKYAKKSWTFTAVKTGTSVKFASLDPPGTYGPVIAGISVKKN